MGWVDIKLNVKNINDQLQYYVSTTTYLDDGKIYKENGQDTPLRMSGVEFSLGALFNLTKTSMILTKTVTGEYEVKDSDKFTYYVQNSKGEYFDINGRNKGTTKTGIQVKNGERVVVIKLIEELNTGKTLSLERIFTDTCRKQCYRKFFLRNGTFI